MDDIYEDIKKYSLYNKRKILIVFGDMIGDMLSNNNLNPIKLFNRGKNLNISLVFITQCYFLVRKSI